MNFFDTHAHYDDEKFNDDREEVIKKIRHSGVSRCINVGCDIGSSQRSIELAEKYDFIYAMCGIHPCEICLTKEGMNEDIFKIENLAKSSKKVVAIGEIGFDYYWNKDTKDFQKKFFVKQIELANKLGLPISIHTRDAIDDTIRLLKEIKIENGGVLHCCPFNEFLVSAGLKSGLHIAFGGTCTFKNSKNAEAIVKMVPLDKILIETDSPYLAPEPVRGTRNDSSNLKFVIDKIASFKGMTSEELAKITFENACNLFRIGG